MANQIAPTTIMILLWAFEIVPIEGETQPDPKKAQFVDSVIGCVQPYMHQTPLTTWLHMAEPRSLSVVNSVHAPKRLFNLSTRPRSVLERNYNVMTSTRRGLPDGITVSRRVEPDEGRTIWRSEERRNRALIVDHDAGGLSKSIF